MAELDSTRSAKSSSSCVDTRMMACCRRQTGGVENLHHVESAFETEVDVHQDQVGVGSFGHCDGRAEAGCGSDNRHTRGLEHSSCSGAECIAVVDDEAAPVGRLHPVKAVRRRRTRHYRYP